MRRGLFKCSLLIFGAALFCHIPEGVSKMENWTLNIPDTMNRLQKHLEALTVTIGERSVVLPENLHRTQEYIENFYRSLGLHVKTETYAYENFTVANVFAEISFGTQPSQTYLIGAHYDSVAGTVGADDNASAVAVQLETARILKALEGHADLHVTVKFVSFALEEPPVFTTRYMGSRVHAANLVKHKERIDGMICLEMVGYTCRQPGCQDYPFPLMFMGYPKEGNFIGIVGNFPSRSFTSSLKKSFEKNTDLPVVTLSVPFNGWLMPAVRLSDHSSFWDKGIKAVMVTDTAFYRNPHYHFRSDTMEKLDYRFMAELVESLLIFLRSHTGESP